MPSAMYSASFGAATRQNESFHIGSRISGSPGAEWGGCVVMGRRASFIPQGGASGSLRQLPCGKRAGRADGFLQLTNLRAAALGRVGPPPALAAQYAGA